MNKIILKVLPYLASVLAGFLFYHVGDSRTGNLGGLFLNISGAFFVIPVVYLFYQSVSKFSHNRLNKEIRDYVKRQIDSELLFIIGKIQKILYFPEEANLSVRNTNKLLALKKDKLRDILTEKEHLGFQVLKRWTNNEDFLNQILTSGYTFQALEDEQIIAVILVIKSLRHIESIQRIEGLFSEPRNTTNEYKAVWGKDIDERNIKFPNRYLLLKKEENGEFSKVKDFGDFREYDIQKLTRLFKTNKRHLESYTNALSDLIEKTKHWLDLTGKEFVVDTKMFQMKQE